jgi:hypothetical protein
MEVEVEILDVTEAEARELLLSIDPLVGLGQMQEQLYERLGQTTPARQPELEALWEEAARRSVEALERGSRRVEQAIPEQYLVLATCQDERQQVELLERFRGEGLECKALLS